MIWIVFGCRTIMTENPVLDAAGLQMLLEGDFYPAHAVPQGYSLTGVLLLVVVVLLVLGVRNPLGYRT